VGILDQPLVTPRAPAAPSRLGGRGWVSRPLPRTRQPPARRPRLAARLAAGGPAPRAPRLPAPRAAGLRRRRLRKCGRAGCACASDPAARPGKYLSVHLDGRTQTLHLRPEDENAWVPPESAALQALAEINRVLVERTASCETTATIDHDGTIIESHKGDARLAYEGTRGYQPLVALWAEQDLIVADEFRDGNVPGGKDPLSSVRRAFASLPSWVEQRYFRGLRRLLPAAAQVPGRGRDPLLDQRRHDARIALRPVASTAHVPGQLGPVKDEPTRRKSG